MFKDNLISLRKINNMSQEELADRLMVSRQTVSKYETGESLPDIEKCRMIADVFNVSLDDLVTYEPDGTGLGIIKMRMAWDLGCLRKENMYLGW